MKIARFARNLRACLREFEVADEPPVAGYAQQGVGQNHGYGHLCRIEKPRFRQHLLNSRKAGGDMRRLILNNLNRRRSISIFSAVGIVVFIFLLTGCVGPPALRSTVIGYDQITDQLEQELMLLNIARLHHMNAPHYTLTGSIAATFDFTTTAGAGGTLEESPGVNSLELNWGASASENPTFQIIPVSGQEFTKRLVTPLPEDAYSLLLFQGFDIPILTRLMADGFELQDRNGHFQRYISNYPMYSRQYEEFRRFTMHLAGLWNNQKLFVRDLVFNEVVIDGLRTQPKGRDLWQGKGLKWWLNPDGTWKVTRRRKGRTLISNYDTQKMTNNERFELNKIAQNNADNFVMVDIRPGHPGGDYPFFGAIKLRSFLNIIFSVGQGIDQIEEFNVAKDPRTPEPIGDNPRQTLAINVMEQAPPPGVPKALYRGKYYTLADSLWDRKAFILLGILFQVTVTDVSQVGIPITIAK